MNKSLALECKKLSELLAKSYKLERVSGSKFLKKFMATDKDLQAIAPDRQAIRDIVMDCFRLKGDARLPITEETLPKKPTAIDLATASLHQIAQALENCHDPKLGAAHLAKAKQLLKLAQRQYAKKNPSIDSVDVVGACSIIEALAEPALKSIEAAKKTHEQVKKDTAKRNERLDAAIIHMVQHAPSGKYWHSNNELADDIWEEMDAPRENGEDWHNLTNKDLLSKKLGWQTVFDHVQSTNALKANQKKE